MSWPLRLEVEAPGLPARRYPVLVCRGDGPARLAEVVAALRPSAAVLVADEAVAGHFAADRTRVALGALLAGEVRVPPGETSKSPAQLERVWHGLHGAGLDREGVVVALGGGVTGDLAGFAAATWLRGVRVVHVPTTLLAMVDSALGGKTGIDLDGKNLVGAFHAPSGVVADLTWLETLPPRQVRCGLAEAWKTGILAGSEAFDRLERYARGRDQTTLAQVVADCLHHKAAVVARDEREHGERASLNLGHTLGHAIEAWSLTTPAPLLHGEAVAIGVAFSIELARDTGRVTDEVAARLRRLGEALGLDLALPRAVTLDDLRPWLGRDKKARAGVPRWILPACLGGWEMARVDDAAIARAFAALPREPDPRASGWTLVDCDILRDGGSYEATLAMGPSRTSLLLAVLPWDHPRDMRYGALHVCHGARDGRPLAIGSSEEGEWRDLLASLRAKAPEQGNLDRMVAILEARRA